MKNLNKTKKLDCCLSTLLWVSLALLVAGLCVPMLMIKSFWIFSHQTSILSALTVLLQHGNYGIFMLVFIFSVLFPAAKLISMLWLWYFGDAKSKASQKLLRVSAALGKWSMLDVFVLANIIVAVRLGVIAQMSVEFGIYFFASAILLSLFASHRIHKLATVTNY